MWTTIRLARKRSPSIPVPRSYKFATYERDPETGLDYAILRYYNSRLGRFMSPDLLAGSVGNPQSLNLYAYVQNDPINYFDSLGLERNPCHDAWDRPERGFPLPLPPAGGGGGSGGSSGGGGSPGGGTTGGNFPNGESLGIPTGMRFPQLTLCQLMGLCPIAPNCDFGQCVPGAGFSSKAIPWPVIIEAGAGVAKIVRAASLFGILGHVLTWKGDAPVRPKDCMLVSDTMSRRDGVRSCLYSCPSGRNVLLQGKGMLCPKSIPDYWAP